MLRYSAIRILLMIPIIICVTFIIYWLVDLAPGTIVDTILPYPRYGVGGADAPDGVIRDIRELPELLKKHE